MDFIASYHLEGLIIGLSTFLIIGAFHPVVIWSEYWFGTRCWWFFLVLGIISLAVSLLCKSILGSALLGVLGFTSLWTIKELFDQKKRVEKGWFPANPKRKNDRSQPNAPKKRN